MTDLQKVSVHSGVNNYDHHQEEQLRKDRDWSVLRQHLAALLANLAALSGGVCLGWTAPALPLLQREETNVTLPLYITVDEGSWISGLLPLGALVGALPAGVMATYMGRKKAILSMALPYIVGWLFILFADESLPLVYIGRFIGGLSLGAISVLVPQYNEEIAEDAIRGALGVYLDFMFCTGVLLVNVFGAIMSYWWFSISSSIIPVIFLATFFWMPESPVYLILQDRMDEAATALSWFRKGKKSYDVHEELTYLKDNLMKQSQEKDKRPLRIVLKEFFNEFSFTSTTSKTVAIVYGLMIFQQVGGVNGILFYIVQIFNQAGSSLSSNVSSIIVALCLTVSDLCASLYVDRLGRRPMLLISALVTGVCHAALSAFFHYKDNYYDVDSWNWVPITSLIIYVISFTVGFSALPWLMMAELVPTKAKGWANPGAVSLNWALVFLVTKEFPDMQRYLGNDVTYGIFSSMCILSFVFVLLWVPETKGKSREEIQEALSGKKK